MAEDSFEVPQHGGEENQNRTPEPVSIFHLRKWVGIRRASVIKQRLFDQEVL
ncbi:MAG: hypothetical protein QOJ64_1618 [Acidobacteriota bacterium]|nr:hypothetical protein [Acidobacteriota bacterium]